MYPQSPRNSFLSDQKAINCISSERSACSPLAYPNSSNDSSNEIKSKHSYISNIYKYNTPSKITSLNCTYHQQSNEFKELIPSISYNTNLQEPYEKFYNEDLVQPIKKSAIAEAFIEKNHINNIQIGSLLTPDTRLSSEKLIDIIYKKQNEFQLLKLQYDEIRKKELNWEKDCELNIAKQNEMRTTIVNLQNLINELRNKKKYEVNILAHQLQAANSNKTIYKQIDQLLDTISDIRNEIIKLNNNQISSQFDAELEKLCSVINQIDFQFEINSELKCMIEEKNELIDLIDSLSSSSFYATDLNLTENTNSEYAKQMNIYLFDRIQILKFKLKRSNQSNKKNLQKLISLIEKFELENTSHPIICEIKNNIRNYINSS